MITVSHGQIYYNGRSVTLLFVEPYGDDWVAHLLDGNEGWAVLIDEEMKALLEDAKSDQTTLDT